MPQYNALDIMKVLKQHGYFLVRQKGSHQIFKNNEGIMVPVPFHGKKRALPLGTALGIIKQSKIPRDNF